MATLSQPSAGLGSAVVVPAASTMSVVAKPNLRPTLSVGTLRIGGDSPDGLVLVGAAPAARTVDLFDRESRMFVGTTTSSGSGTYAFTGLAARTEGYDVVIRGVIASGERDVIVPGVQPG